MKLLILTFFLLVSLNSLASTISTAGLDSTALDALQTMTMEESVKMNECLEEAGTNVIESTSCINEVLGDIY